MRNRHSGPGAETNFRGYGHCSDHVGETLRVAAVTKPKPHPDQLEDLLRRLLAKMAAPVPVPAPVPEVPMVEKFLQRLVAESCQIVPLRTADIGTADSAETSQKRSEWRRMFFMGKVGSCCNSLPRSG